MKMQEMRASFGGKCRKCHKDFPKGTLILWGRKQGSEHKVCPTGGEAGASEAAVAPAGIPAEATLQVWLSRHGKPALDSEVGRVLRDDRHGKIVKVLAQRARYIPEDGDSLGLDGMDRGWLVVLHCREATAEEAAPIEAAERAEKEALEAARARDEARRRLFGVTSGEYVIPADGKQMRLVGTWVRWGEGFNAYGGGEQALVEDGGQYVWWVWNNGHDGDCWDRNNVSTGGAGAIGRRYPATEERLAFIRSLPGGELVGKTALERRREIAHVYRAQIRTIRPELAGLFDDDPVDAVQPLPSVWAELGVGDVYQVPMVGMDPNGTHIYLSVFCDNGGPQPRDHDIWTYGDRRVYLEYEVTPARAAAIRALWPAWVGTCAPGRYVLKTAFGKVADNAADALIAMHNDKVDLARVEVTPGVTLVCASPGVEAGIGGVLVWSDGVGMSVQSCVFCSLGRHDPRAEPWRTEQIQHLDGAGFPAPPAPAGALMRLAPAAVDLLVVALRQKCWNASERFRKLFTVVAFEQVDIAHRGELRPGRTSSDATLRRLDVEHADGTEEGLWMIHQRWVDIGEDADAGDKLSLFAEEAAARAAFSAVEAA